MKRLVIFEYKKMWGQITRLAILAFALLVIMDSGRGIFGADIINDKGEIIQGVTALRELKKGSKELSGEIDQKYLDNLIQKYNSSEVKKIYDNDGMRKSKYSDPNYLVNFISDGPNFSKNNLDINFDFMKSEEDFYNKYKDSIKEDIKVLNQFNGVVKYTKEELNLINEKVDKIQTPIKIDYSQGLKNIMYEYNGDYRWVLFAILFTLAVLFSKDSHNGIDELSLCSKFGRKKHMNAKIVAGNLFILTVHTILLVLLFVMNILASPLKGFTQSIQTLWYTCYYNISLGMGVIIAISLGFLGVLVIGNFIMLLSIKFKNSKVTVSAAILFILGLIKLTSTTDLLQLQLNPLYFGTHKLSANIPEFETYYFMK